VREGAAAAAAVVVVVPIVAVVVVVVPVAAVVVVLVAAVTIIVTISCFERGREQGSTHNPPHEQWLVRLEAGAGSLVIISISKGVGSLVTGRRWDDVAHTSSLRIVHCFRVSLLQS
jgi:uncharacterized membrane protein YphA (DoxX/SURF4 family)